MKAAWVAFSPLLLVAKDNLEPSAQTCLTLQWRINSNTWKQLQHTLSPKQAPVPHRGQTWSWQGLLGTGLGCLRCSLLGEMNGGSGAFLPGEHPLLQPCQHSKLCSYDARSNRVNRPKPETVQGTAPSRSPLYLSAITNFQLGCQRIPDDGHGMFTKGNLKRNLSAMKVKGFPPLFWHPDLP